MYNILNSFKLNSVVSVQFRQYVRSIRPRNPGIENQLKLLNKTDQHTDMQNLDFDDMESDFSEISKSHKDFEKELKHYKEKEKLWIVKGKYFKSKNYNFLTWAEKEQIKYLHEQDREEWNVERLAESFPSSEFVISKVLKSAWNCSTERITNHDRAVENNWKLLKSGEIEIDAKLKKHLLKFANRNQLIPDCSNPIATRHLDHTYKPSVTGEFYSIISNYESSKYENKHSVVKKQQPLIQEKIEMIRKPKKEMYLIDLENVNASSHTTLGELKKQIIKKNLCSEISANDEPILKKIHTDETANLKIINNELPHFKNTKSNNTAMIEQENAKIQICKYREHIKVPEKLWKKGGTYKLDDCFYDDDGEFLYRVPGLAGNK